jgi:DNA-binding NarL/FixJ family response regulator
MDRPAEAVTQLLKDKIDLVISHWVLIDTPNGELLRYIIAAKPNLPTIAFVKAGDSQQEALARQIGVSVVLSDDINDAYFRQILRQIFDLAETPPIRGICQVSQG